MTKTCAKFQKDWTKTVVVTHTQGTVKGGMEPRILWKPRYDVPSEKAGENKNRASRNEEGITYILIYYSES